MKTHFHPLMYLCVSMIIAGSLFYARPVSALIQCTPDTTPPTSVSGAFSGILPLSGNPLSGTAFTAPLSSGQTFTIRCFDTDITKNIPPFFDTVTVNVIPPPGSISVNLTGPASVLSGTAPTLTWTTSGTPNSCTASVGWSGSKNVLGGSETVAAITVPTTYTITCTKAGASNSPQASLITVGVSAIPPPGTPTINPATPAPTIPACDATGGKVALSYSQAAGGVTTDYYLYRNPDANNLPQWGLIQHTTALASLTSPDINLTSGTTYRYQLEARNSNASPAISVYSQPVSAVANSICGGITATLTASPTSIVSGNYSVLSWTSSTGAPTYSCTSPDIPGFAGMSSTLQKNNLVGVTVFPSVNTTYHLSCTDSLGQNASPTATVTVTTPLLQVQCSRSPAAVDLASNQPVTWTATVTGGAAPYTYTWYGDYPLAPRTVQSSSLANPVVDPESVLYTTIGTYAGYVVVTDSTSPVQQTASCPSQSITVTDTRIPPDFALIYNPTVYLNFVGTTAESAPIPITVISTGGFSSNVTVTASSASGPSPQTKITLDGTQYSVKYSLFNHGTRTIGSSISNGNYSSGLDLVMSAFSRIPTKTYPGVIQIIGTGGGKTHAYTLNLNVGITAPTFQEF